MLLESDASFKERTEQRLEDLERRIAASGAREGLLATTAAPTSPPEHAAATTTVELEIASPGLNLSCSLGAFPASSMTTPQRRPGVDTSSTAKDLIDRGIITVEDATKHSLYYRQHLDIFLHYECAAFDTLAKLRARSSLMTAAICTVSAYCQNSSCFEACLEAYMAEITLKLFGTTYVFDDVRALCVGALWLGHISPTLIGQAVRIGSQLDLHRCITKMPHSKLDCYERTRLYFLLCTVDHQCSLMYGRPPMTYEWQTLKNPRVFLESPFARRTDDDLVHQLEFWTIGRRVFQTFGADVENGMANYRQDVLIDLSQAYERWFGDDTDLAATASSRGDLWSRLSRIYYHSAKLHLFSHTFRGTTEIASTYGSPEKTTDAAAVAVDAAIAVLCGFCEGQTTQRWTTTLPHYFVTTIAFACVVLIKICSQRHGYQRYKIADCQTTLWQLRDTMRTCFSDRGSNHPIYGIVRGLEAAVPDSQQLSDALQTTTANFDFDLDVFLADPAMWSLPGFDDQWLHCPDESMQ